MLYRLILVVIVLGVALSRPLFASDDASVEPFEVSIEAELAPIKASHRDLVNIIEQIQRFAASANAARDGTHSVESLQLQDGRLSLSLQGGFSEVALSGAPSVAYYAYYSYSSVHAPVSNVQIRLTDASRSVKVAGGSREQVLALHGLLVQSLEQHTTWCGGFTFRLIGYIVLFAGSLLAAVCASIAERRRLYIGLLVAAGLFFLSAHTLPWHEWLPGTAIHPGSASFSERHAPLITLVGTVVTIAAFVLTIAGSNHFWRKGSQPGKNGGQEPTYEESPSDKTPAGSLEERKREETG